MAPNIANAGELPVLAIHAPDGLPVPHEAVGPLLWEIESGEVCGSWSVRNHYDMPNRYAPAVPPDLYLKLPDDIPSPWSQMHGMLGD